MSTHSLYSSLSPSERAHSIAASSTRQLDLWNISRDNILETVRDRLGDATAIQCWMEPLNVKFLGEAGRREQGEREREEGS